ncbi:MAG: hypothetical protein EOP22_07110 [Hyphomicrobiales bacterium]|nr:MAG: hypothetical protein EOP22_07110 [Hyphomicrobiales bacterium]
MRPVKQFGLAAALVVGLAAPAQAQWSKGSDSYSLFYGTGDGTYSLEVRCTYPNQFSVGFNIFENKMHASLVRREHVTLVFSIDGGEPYFVPAVHFDKGWLDAGIVPISFPTPYTIEVAKLFAGASRQITVELTPGGSDINKRYNRATFSASGSTKAVAATRQACGW